MEDASHGSITEWIDGIKHGQADAGKRLYERYNARILALARSKLGSAALLGGDEEDVALSVFGDLFDGAPRARFPALEDREDLWSLLAKITVRKVADLKKRERVGQARRRTGESGIRPGDRRGRHGSPRERPRTRAAAGTGPGPGG